MNSSFGRDTPHPLRLLVNQVPAMLAYWDRDLRCRFANRAYEHWFGVNPDAMVGMSIRDLLGEKLFALNEPFIRAALDGREQIFERLVPGPDGTRRHSLATYVPDVVDGEVMGFIAHVADVTRLKETETALRLEIAQREQVNALLRASESSLREAQRLGRVGSWEWEIEPDITMWSDELYHLFGLDRTRSPPSYAEHAALYTAESWSELQVAVAHTLRSAEPYTLELRYVGANGVAGWLEVHGEAVKGAGGQVVKLRGTVHEVTLRHRAEEARIRIRAAESANRYKTLLMSRASHELRTPLNAILGFAQLFQLAPDLAPKYRAWADLIADNGRHLLELVEKLIDLSAAQSGRPMTPPTDIDLVKLLRTTVALADESAHSASLTLVGPGDDAAPILMHADPAQLQPIVDNLQSNAIKYTPAGGKVTVSAADLHDRVEIAVEDTGIGLSAEQIDRIGSPFDRLGAEWTTLPGSGLGLALTKTLVGLLGGALRVESVEGAGSIFRCVVPKRCG